MQLSFAVVIIIVALKLAVTVRADAASQSNKLLWRRKLQVTAQSTSRSALILVSVGGVPADARGALDPYYVALERQLKTASTTAFVNILINSLRPDDWIPWPARIPRLMWEAAICATSGTCAMSISTALVETIHRGGITESGVHIRLLLLCLMTLTTALVDIFVWAPIASWAVQWERCTGGGDGLWFLRRPSERICTSDYVTGFGRILVTIQCSLSGVVYLATAVASYDAARRLQRNEKLNQHQTMLERIITKQRGETTGPSP
jgi:hypothetical protein